MSEDFDSFLVETTDAGISVRPKGSNHGWVNGTPVTLLAAAMDAELWLELIEKQIDSGRWRFGSADNRAKLAGCREALREQIRASLSSSAGTKGGGE